ncbi:MAG: CHAT domain-containing protein [Planctomycetes bacterium]|nr:CHAT domain-containing protein [Planctomycetota bacterium]
MREELLRLQRAESGAHAAGRAARGALERVDLGRLGPRERVLYYLEARGVLHGVLLAGAPGGVRVLRALRLDVSARGVEAELTRLRFQVQKYRHGRDYVARHSAHVQRAFERVLQELGRALVAPFLDPSLAGEALRDGDALVVVPYGALHEVPFAGLAVDGRALVERVDVSLARSLGQLRADAGVARRAVLSCLGAAEDLPEVERERAAFDAWGALEACDVDAFLARLAGGVEGAVLHLAAHGSYEPQHPLFSGVRLGARHLTAFDIARLALPECLVLLSGCETGRQANPRGEELYGPEQAFFRAGARGVVSCLWPVADSAGASFVAELARALDEGLDVRAATSRAQRVAAGRGAPPQDWAGFVYAGDPGLRLAAR